MTEQTKRILYWTPRVIGVAFTLFISLFAFDVFGQGRGFWETFLDLNRHLIPAYVLAGTVALAWRWEWVGAIIPAGLAGLFLWWNYNYRHNVLVAVLTIAGPLFAMSVLFLVGWLKRETLRAGR